MSTFDDDIDYEDDEPQAQAQAQSRNSLTNAEVRILRKQAKEAEEAKAELAKLRQQNAVLTAGLNSLSDRQVKALIATHDGEFTADALRQTAEDLGFVQPPPPEVPDAEVSAHQRIAQASAGADPAANDPLASVLAAQSEGEFWARAREAGVVQ